MQEVFEKIIEELGALKNALTEKYHEARDGENSLECIFDKADILDERARGVVDALKIIRQFATEYNNGWIPVEERLPAEGQNVFVSAKYQGNIRKVKEAVFKNKEFMVSTHVSIMDITEAWKPRFVPAPYKAKED